MSSKQKDYLNDLKSKASEGRQLLDIELSWLFSYIDYLETIIAHYLTTSPMSDTDNPKDTV